MIFLASLRFTIKGGNVLVTSAEDYVPWIGGGLAAATALGTGAFLTRQYFRKPKARTKDNKYANIQATDPSQPHTDDNVPKLDVADQKEFPWQTQVPFDFMTS
jgi:hypothetical protein